MSSPVVFSLTAAQAAFLHDVSKVHCGVRQWAVLSQALHRRGVVQWNEKKKRWTLTVSGLVAHELVTVLGLHRFESGQP